MSVPHLVVDPTVNLLEIILPTYNRPLKLYECLKSAEKHLRHIPKVRVVVIDDGSDKAEWVKGSLCSTQDVVRLFPEDFIHYIRNETNLGLAENWCNYYKTHCNALYTTLVNDKDLFINATPILSALKKLEENPSLSMIMIPLKSRESETKETLLTFKHTRMSGKKFIETYIRDTNLQHVGGYAIVRAAAIRKAKVPRNLNLKKFGLQDAFGIDVDHVLNVAATGDVEFETECHVSRCVYGGLTEKYPLLFAYCYYQYVKHLMKDLGARQFVSKQSRQDYVAWWHLLMLRGLSAMYRYHPQVTKEDKTFIKQHLRLPFVLFLIKEMFKNRTSLSLEMYKLFAFLIIINIPIVNYLWLYREKIRNTSLQKEKKCLND